MIYVLLEGHHAEIISLHSSLDLAQHQGNLIIEKYNYLSIEEWNLDVDNGCCRFWHKFVSKNPLDQSFDWKVVILEKQ
jgi:hypothetical protein